MAIAHKIKRIDDAELQAGLEEEIAFRVPGSAATDGTQANGAEQPECAAASRAGRRARQTLTAGFTLRLRRSSAKKPDRAPSAFLGHETSLDLEAMVEARVAADLVERNDGPRFGIGGAEDQARHAGR